MVPVLLLIVNNQLIKTADTSLEKTYQYDGRGNLSRVMSGTDVLQRYTFDAANFMTGAEDVTNPASGRAEYGYNGMGKRISQQIFQKDSQDMQNPMKKIEYTLDLTREYYNLLGLEDQAAGTKQAFFWDGNVAAMEEDGKHYYYLQDDLGSVTNLTGRNGESRERFAFDEFGLPVFHGINGTETEQGFTGMVQPFAFTGYQPDETTGLYYAQARRYDAGAGRFVSEDLIRGFTALPSTLHAYNYCISNPLIYVDEDGQFWHIVIGAVIGAVVNVGFTAYDAYQEGGWDAFKSSKTWKNIGVSALKGGVEGAATAAFGPVGAGLSVAGVEFGTDTIVQLASNEKVKYEKNISNALLSGLTAYGLGKGSSLLKNACYGKSNVIVSGEIKDILDDLVKYSRSGAADVKEALKLIASYITQESAWGITSNRTCWGENEMFDLLLSSSYSDNADKN